MPQLIAAVKISQRTTKYFCSCNTQPAMNASPRLAIAWLLGKLDPCACSMLGHNNGRAAATTFFAAAASNEEPIAKQSILGMTAELCMRQARIIIAIINAAAMLPLPMWLAVKKYRNEKPESNECTSHISGVLNIVSIKYCISIW